MYWLITSSLLGIISNMLLLRFKLVVKHIKGELDGIKYLFNKEYKQLPVVKKGKLLNYGFDYWCWYNRVKLCNV